MNAPLKGVVMTPSQIRSELLGQHQSLRTMMDETKREAERCVAGHEAIRPLKRCLCELANALRMHNLREEELLGDVLPDSDAWGKERAETMLDEHVREHEMVYATLLTFGAFADREPACVVEPAVATVLELIARIASHMEHEEEAYLAEDVLTESTIPADSFSG
jgi:hypothetical protein